VGFAGWQLQPTGSASPRRIESYGWDRVLEARLGWLSAAALISLPSQQSLWCGGEVLLTRRLRCSFGACQVICCQSLSGSCQIWLAQWQVRWGQDAGGRFLAALVRVSAVVVFFYIVLALLTNGGFVSFVFGFRPAFLIKATIIFLIKRQSS
jgi:hypothetical protein